LARDQAQPRATGDAHEVVRLDGLLVEELLSHERVERQAQLLAEVGQPAMSRARQFDAKRFAFDKFEPQLAAVEALRARRAEGVS
jgi:hypothetical protein